MHDAFSAVRFQVRARFRRWLQRPTEIPSAGGVVGVIGVVGVVGVVGAVGMGAFVCIVGVVGGTRVFGLARPWKRLLSSASG